jgi:hypothetical protein
MKRHIRCELVAALCLLYPALTLNAQTAALDEETVRNAYAKLSLLCAVDPLTDSGIDQLGGKQVDDIKLNAKMAAATPVFTLSSFRAGNIADIATDQMRQFVSLPQSGSNVLSADLVNFSNSDSGNPTSWVGARAAWRASPQVTPDVEKSVGDQTVAEAVKIGAPQWSASPATYTRYAAFTVDATFQGKSTGPHQAIFFFGTDAKGHAVVAINDLLSGPQALWQMFDQNTYPTGLLSSKLRETPVVATWIRANEMPTSSCDAAKHDLCCSHGRCGISAQDLNHDLAAALPRPKNGDPQ